MASIKIKFKNTTLKIKIKSCRVVAGFLITQSSRDYRLLSRSYLIQKRAVAIHQSFHTAYKKCMRVYFKMVDLVEGLCKISSTEMDFITELKYIDRRWGSCIVTKI